MVIRIEIGLSRCPFGDDASISPQPMQSPRPRWIGGLSPAAIRARAAEIDRMIPEGHDGAALAFRIEPRRSKRLS